MNKVFIATSLDGFIADKEGGVDWLDTVPNTDSQDMGYVAFMEGIDALVMGRNTFETVCGFDVPWPYEKSVFVLSSHMTEIPQKCAGKKVEILKGTVREVLKEIHEKGYKDLYIDGGKTIQSFLEQDLIDEMIITVIPVVLGEGIPLFGRLSKSREFQCTESKRFLDAIVQNRFIRKGPSE